MKHSKMKVLFTLTATLLTLVVTAQYSKATLQDSLPTSKANKVITIQLSGTKAEADKTTIEINGDKITINGKDAKDMEDIEVQIGDSKFKYYKKGHRDVYGELGMGVDNIRAIRKKLDSLGVSIRNIKTKVNNRPMLGITMYKTNNGIAVESLVKDGAATKAGLKKGDVINKLNTTDITTEMDITNTISKLKIGDEVTITYIRNGTPNTTKAVLTANQVNKDLEMFFNADSVHYSNLPDMDFLNMDQFSFDFKQDKPRIHLFGNGHSIGNTPKLGVGLRETESGNGVEVTKVDSASIAAKAGLQVGDIITSIGATQVNDIKNIRKLISSIANMPIELIYLRNGKQGKAIMQFPKELKEGTF